MDYDNVNNMFRVRNYVEHNGTASTIGTPQQYYDFLPFNYTGGYVIGTYRDDGEAYNLESADVNYWFGMRMDVDFYQSKDGKLLSSETVNDTTLKITFELDGEKAVCLCDEEKVRFELASASYDMLFKYKELRNTNIEEIGGSSVKYEHGSMSYGLKLSCKVSGEENGYRISPEGDSLELCFQRFGKK